MDGRAASSDVLIGPLDIESEPTSAKCHVLPINKEWEKQEEKGGQVNTVHMAQQMLRHGRGLLN